MRFVFFLVILAFLTAEARDRGRGDRDRGRRGGGKLMRILDEICDIDARDECEDGEKGYYRQAESGSCRFTELPEAEELPDECEEGTQDVCFLCVDKCSQEVITTRQFEADFVCEENRRGRLVINEDDSTCREL